MNPRDSLQERVALKIRPCAAAIALVLSLPLALTGGPTAASVHSHQPASIVVGNCNDAGPGSLRDAVANAISGDMIDLSQLTCSTISVTSGAIEIPQNDLYLKYSGEGGTPPTIEGNLTSRIFHHTGTGTLRLVGLTIRQGKYDNTNIYFSVPASGGCIYSAGNVYLAGSTVSGCVAQDTRGADATGGGIYVVQSLTLKHSIVSGNTATSTARFGDGGGVFTHGAIDVEYSSVSGNVASGLDYDNRGGGIAVVNFGTAPSQIANSTIDGNRADRAGGLLISGGATYGASVTIRNSTISGNTANVEGGAAYLRGPLTLTNSTIAFNQSQTGPGVELASHTDPVEFQSSIVAENSNATDDYDLGSQGYNITISGSNNLIVNANVGDLPPDTISDDPLLQPLADNGGPTLTHALGGGSPAIDHGNNPAGQSTDQRGTGYPRVFGAAADIGAFELQSVDDTIFVNGFDP
jgi:hypothetical protein